MGKKKNKAKKTALQAKLKKTENPPKAEINPFELRINHERYKVLGRKSKNEKGMPGISRNKAIKKRKEFMFKNKLLTSKSNRFIDKRIGEYDKTVLREDQIAARLMHERRKKLKRNIYNLNDDEELTHLGKPLSLLETLDNPLSNSDDDDEDKLDASFVEDAHFGGFLTKKSSDEPPKTHKEIIGELILESKRKKEEKKLEREKTMDLTDQLDKQWKEVISEMGKVKVGNMKCEKKPDASERDPYDMIVQELKFEPRGAPTDKLKTVEEIAKEEKEKLKKLEKERLLRMEDSTEVRREDDQLLSADSIYDGLDIDLDFVPETAVDDKITGDFSQQDESGQEGIETNDSSESESSQDGDRYSDLDSGNEEMEAENEEISESVTAGVNTKTPASKHACAGSLGELLEILCTYSSDVDVSFIIATMIKNNHPGLGAENRRKMESLFKTLLDYIDHICKEGIKYSEIVNSLVPHLYSLAQMSPLNCASIFRDVLLRELEILKKQRKSASFKKHFPHVTSLILLKICGILYSTSDFRHPVVIIAMSYMSEVLSHKFLITYENVISRLFITNLFFEYVALSKRYVPEAINFLRIVLYCSSVTEDLEPSQAYRTACQGDYDFFLLKTEQKCEPQKLSIKVFSETPIQGSDELKVSIISNAVKQIHYFVGIYSSLPSSPELFSSVHNLLKNMPVMYYPASLQQSFIKLDDDIEGMMAQKRSYLVFPFKKPRPLKLFEPEFDTNFGNKNKAKLVKDLTKKVKREEKGVLREIRRDAQFLAHQQLQEIVAKDQERRNKVKRLFQDLSVQQGEIKTLYKKKK